MIFTDSGIIRFNHTFLYTPGAIIASMCTDAIELFELEARLYKKTNDDPSNSIIARELRSVTELICYEEYLVEFIQPF